MRSLLGASPTRWGVGICLSVLAVAAGCNKTNAPPDRKAQAQVPAVPSPEAQKVDDAAKFLAGIKGRSNSEYRDLEEQPAWQSHASQMDSLWAQFDTKQLKPAREFYKREIQQLGAPQGGFVFYPFGGPDVIYVTTFFPQGRTYVLAGLEPVGSVPAPAMYTAKNLEPTFGSLRESAGIFRRSFFVTSEMDRQFRGRVTDGLTPMILLLLARTGHTVFGMRYVGLTPEGKLVAASQPKPKGVEIEFRRQGDTESRKMYYFSGDLSNAKVEANPGFIKFAEGLGPSDTLIKSASFLLHWKEFTMMRQLVMDNSNVILQDDTGIPYRLLKKDGWKVSFYGKYSAPDKPFKGQYQKDLEAAFEEPGSARDLGFSLGYGYGRRSSHLVFARKSKLTAQTTAPSR